MIFKMIVRSANDSIMIRFSFLKNSRFLIVFFSFIYTVLLVHHYYYDGWINPDLGRYIHGVRNFMSHGEFVLDDEARYLLCPVFNWIVLLVFKVFGIGILQSKITAFIFGLLCLYPLYGISFRLTNDSIASFFVAAFLLLDPNMFIAIKCGQAEPVYFFFFLMSVYCAIVAVMERPNKSISCLSGIFFGVSFLVKPVIATRIIIILLILLMYHKRDAYEGVVRNSLERIVLFIMGLCLVIGSWMLYLKISGQYDLYWFNMKFSSTSQYQSHWIRTFMINPVRSLYDPTVAFFNRHSAIGLLFFPLLSIYLMVKFLEKKKNQVGEKINKIFYRMFTINWRTFSFWFFVCGFLPLIIGNIQVTRKSVILLFPVYLSVVMILKFFSKTGSVIFVSIGSSKINFSRRPFFYFAFLAALPVFPIIRTLSVSGSDFKNIFTGTCLLFFLHLLLCVVAVFVNNRLKPKVVISFAFSSCIFVIAIMLGRIFGCDIAGISDGFSFVTAVHTKMLFWLISYVVLSVILFAALSSLFSAVMLLQNFNPVKTGLIVITGIVVIQLYDYYQIREEIEIINYKQQQVKLSGLLSPTDIVLGENFTPYLVMHTGVHFIKRDTPGQYFSHSESFQLREPVSSLLGLASAVRDYALWIYKSPITTSTYATDMSLRKSMNANYMERFRPTHILANHRTAHLYKKEWSDAFKETKLRLVCSLGSRIKYDLYEIKYN